MRAFSKSAFSPEPSNLFRLAWNLADNAMTWLEPTRQCNITCDACFVENKANSHKSLECIESELHTLLSLRRCDAMLIAGGEPLIHPQILEIVRLVKSLNVKPVLITNGTVLNRNLAIELKKAGAYGITFHVDSHQSRPDWKGKNERELNTLRQQYADTLHEVGGLTCAFNITVFPDTLDFVPDILKWAVDNSDRVQIVTFICVRMAERDDRFDYHVGSRSIDVAAMPYTSNVPCGKLTTGDIYLKIKKILPSLEFCAYLGGTANPHSLKWVVGSHLVSDGKSIGYLGMKSMELFQNTYHFFKGKYLAYTKPSASKMGKLSLLLAIIDPQMRKALRVFAGAVFKSPRRLLKPIYIQSVSVVQPVDILESGEQDSCDGCPNTTLWKDTLVSACRLEDYRHFGGPILTSPRSRQHKG